MIGFIEGTVRHGSVMCGGVGYQVRCAEPLLEGEQVELHVDTIVREDDIRLFGFRTADERALFQALRAVPKVGPSTALTLMRDVGMANILAAAAQDNPKVLELAKGVGKTSAVRILASFKVPEHLRSAAVEPGRADAVRSVCEALGSLGFDASEASEAASSVVADNPDGAMNDLVRSALAYLR